jgi:hypothetical protein
MPILSEPGLSHPVQSDLTVIEETWNRRCPICNGSLVEEPVEFEDQVPMYEIFGDTTYFWVGSCPQVPKVSCPQVAIPLDYIGGKVGC